MGGRLGTSTSVFTSLQHSCTLCRKKTLSPSQPLLLYLVREGGAGLLKGGDERMRETLQFGLVTNKHFASIRHGNSIQSTATMHTEGTATIHLHTHTH